MDQCAECGREIIDRPRQGPPRRYCSNHCRWTFNNRLKKQRKIEQAEDRLQERELRKSGEEFVAFDPKQKLADLGFKPKAMRRLI